MSIFKLKYGHEFADYVEKRIKPKETPVTKKRFTPELRIEGDEEFKANVENMLRVLKEYSPEWYEKTMYAGEVRFV